MLAAVAAVACSGSTSPGPEASAVIGDWEWSSACCSIAGAAKNPNTEGFTYVLQFSADGTVTAVRNNDLVFTARYSVTRSRPSPGADPVTVVEYSAPLSLGPSFIATDHHVVEKLENGTLILRNAECADCYGDWVFLPRLS